MAAPKGNKFWMLRSSFGPKPRFNSDTQLWDACCQYFQYVEDNPLLEEKIFVVGGKLRKTSLKKKRAMTLAGLNIFLGISHDTWERLRKRKAVSVVAQRVDMIIRNQKFEGAAAGFFNANIIARDLGLQDHTSNEQYGPNKGPIEVKKWVIEFVGMKKEAPRSDN